ncbi:hypothetical protein AGMMS49957_16440 [Synergistales bacterium]|nr:hypothetical protein AGMMS49957_16440 [Synergistales bacterium]
MTDTQLETLATQYKEARQEADNKKAIAESIADAIKSELESRGVERVTVGLFKIFWGAVISHVFNTTLFKDIERDEGAERARHKKQRQRQARSPCLCLFISPFFPFRRTRGG